MNPIKDLYRRLSLGLSGAKITASSRAVQSEVLPHHAALGIGNDWVIPSYGDYYPRSVAVYSAIRVRAEALVRLPWEVSRTSAAGQILKLPTIHPLTALFAQPNPWYSGAELRRATEVNLCLWGRAFWAIESSETTGQQELWPLRPDRVDVLPGAGPRGPYIRGYRYRGLTKELFYLPEEIEYFRYFNPQQDHSGLSPIAPLRLTMDMGHDALRYNRNTFQNGGIPDYFLFGGEGMTQSQIEDFYKRWETRFQGPDKAHRPAIASGVTDMKTLAFSAREMEFIEGMRWAIKDAARVYGVPETMLAELQFATLANMEGLERWFWRSTMIPEATMLADRINSSLLPKLGFPDHMLQFDFTTIEALSEGQEQRQKREVEFLDRGVLTINEVRRERGLPDVSWGNQPSPRSTPRQDPASTPVPSPSLGTNGHIGASTLA